MCVCGDWLPTIVQPEVPSSLGSAGRISGRIETVPATAEWVDCRCTGHQESALTMRDKDAEFPAKCFSFSPKEVFGPARRKCHPHLHPTRYASSSESKSPFRFDAMTLAPNMDLMMSCTDAEKIAQTIVLWNGGGRRTERLEPIKLPGTSSSEFDKRCMETRHAKWSRIGAGQRTFPTLDRGIPLL